MSEATSGELAFLPATEMAQRIRSREISPVDLVRLFLERIEHIDPSVGAYVTVVGQRAMARAKSAEEALMSGDVSQLGPLHGVPIAVKDLTPTAGVRTTFGSAAFEHLVPEMDSPEAARLFAAGAILIGKTNTSELGMSMSTEDGLFPPTRNPWDKSRSAGGSSGGSAAALAARLCPIATGSDAGGSVRIPAAACGVVGLKPSRGRVIPQPFSYAAIAGFATPGPMANTVADLALQMEALTAPMIASSPNRMPTGGPLRIGWTASNSQTKVEPEVVAAVERVAAKLAELGHVVQQDAPDVSGTYRPFYTVMSAHSAANPIPDPGKLGAHARAVIEDGKRLSATDYIQAEMAVLGLHRRLLEWHRRFDVLLCPTLPTMAPPLGTLTGSEQEIHERSEAFGAFTYWVNMTGQPAISLPLAESSEGLPIGVQLVGRWGADDSLLTLASQLEEAMPWKDRVPKVALG